MGGREGMAWDDFWLYRQGLDEECLVHWATGASGLQLKLKEPLKCYKW